jgi:hypothetical protein
LENKVLIFIGYLFTLVFLGVVFYVMLEMLRNIWLNWGSSHPWISTLVAGAVGIGLWWGFGMAVMLSAPKTDVPKESKTAAPAKAGSLSVHDAHVRAGHGSDNAPGGDANLQAGHGYGGASGGDVTIGPGHYSAGNAGSGGKGGDLNIKAGDAKSNPKSTETPHRKE